MSHSYSNREREPSTDVQKFIHPSPTIPEQMIFPTRNMEAYYGLKLKTSAEEKNRTCCEHLSSMCTIEYAKQMLPSIILVIVAILALIASSVATNNINKANTDVASATAQLNQLYATTTLSVNNLQQQVNSMKVDDVMKAFQQLQANLTTIYQENQQLKQKMSIILNEQYDANVNIFNRISELNHTYPYPWNLETKMNNLSSSLQKIDTKWNQFNQSTITYIPAFTAINTNPSIGNGIINATYSRLGERLFLSIRIVGGSTTNWGSGAWRITLPYPYRIDTSKAMCNQEIGLILGSSVMINIGNNGYSGTVSCHEPNTLGWMYNGFAMQGAPVTLPSSTAGCLLLEATVPIIGSFTSFTS